VAQEPSETPYGAGNPSTYTARVQTPTRFASFALTVLGLTAVLFAIVAFCSG
jgi:hypothetical protein